MLAYLDHHGPIAMAHRGGASGGMENSLAAFERAVALGYRYLETDLRVTADGVLIAFHDHTLDRVTDGAGVVDRLPWHVVRRARIGGSEPIPRFIELLDAFPDSRLNLDPKSDAAVAPMVAAIRDADAVDRVCAGSFSDRRLARIRAALGSGLCTSMGPLEVARLRCASCVPGLDVVTPRAAACVQVPVRYRAVPLVDRRLLAAAHRHGLPVHVWTVNDAAAMTALLDLGVDGLVTDALETLRDVLVARGAWTAPTSQP